MALCNASTGNDGTLPKGDLFDLWQRFRAFGFLTGSDVPREYDYLADRLLELLEQLPYVETSRLANALSDRVAEGTTMDLLRQSESRGLLLVPPARRRVGSSTARLALAGA